MSKYDWWRSWHGAPLDHKYPVIAAKAGARTVEVCAVMWALLDYASQNEPRGCVVGFDVESYAVYSGLEQATIKAIQAAMTEKGIIQDGCLVNWGKRQPEREDYSTPRVARHRERMKRGETDETQGNAPEERREESDTDKNIFSVYEAEIGPLTKMITDAILDAEQTYPAEWLPEAIRVAARANARSWAYVEAVLKRWQVDGFQSDRKPRKAAEARPVMEDRNPSLDLLNRMKQEEVAHGN